MRSVLQFFVLFCLFQFGISMLSLQAKEDGNLHEFVIVGAHEGRDYLVRPIADLKGYLQQTCPDATVREAKYSALDSQEQGHLIVLIDYTDKVCQGIGKQYGIDKPLEDWNAFRISTRSRRDGKPGYVFLLEGADSWGQQYAIYDLAERLLGVRYLKPDLDHVIPQPQLEVKPIDTGIEKPDYKWRGLYPWHYNYNGRGLHSFCDINARFVTKDWTWFCQLADWMIKNKQNAVLWFDDVFAHENISGQLPDWVASYYEQRGIRQLLGMGWASNEDLTTGEDWKRQICLNSEGKSIEKESWRRAICPESEAYFRLAGINFKNMNLKHPGNYLGALIGYGENTWAAHEEGVACVKHEGRPSSEMMLRDLNWMKGKFEQAGIGSLPMGFVTSTHSIHQGNPFESDNLIGHLPKDAIFTMHTYQQSGWRQFERLYDKIAERNRKENTNIKVFHIAEVAFLCNADIPLLKPTILRRRSEHYRTLPKENTIGHLATLNTTQYLYWYNTYQLLRWQWHRGTGQWEDENLKTLAGIFGPQHATGINEILNRLLCLECVVDYEQLDSLRHSEPSLLPPSAWSRYNPKTHPSDFGFLLWAGIDDRKRLEAAAQSIEAIQKENETLAAMSDPLYREQFYETVSLTSHYYNIRVQVGLYNQTRDPGRIEAAKASLREYNRLMAKLHGCEGNTTRKMMAEWQRDHVINPTEDQLDKLASETLANGEVKRIDQ